MTIDQETLDAVNEQEPSAVLVAKAQEAIREAHAEMDPSEHRTIAHKLARLGAFALGSQGELLFKLLDPIRTYAPGLLDSPRKPTRVQRAMANERVLTTRLAESRKPPPRPASIEAALAEEIARNPALQGDSARAKAAKSAARERLLKKAHEEAGIPFGRLGSNGVDS